MSLCRVCAMCHGAEESQAGGGGQGPPGPSGPPLSQQGHLEQGAQGHIQAALVDLQGGDPMASVGNLSWEPSQ